MRRQFVGAMATLIVVAGPMNAIAQPATNACADPRKVLELEQRVKELEKRADNGSLQKSRVYAPFEVINEDGYQVLTVENEKVSFYNATGARVAEVVTYEQGSFFRALSTTNKLQAVIGVRDALANVFVVEKDVNRVNLGRNDKGQYGLRVYEPGGKLVAGIGQGTAGDGVVTVSDSQGRQRAAMFVHPDGGGILQVLNASGLEVGTLFATKAGNGQLQLSSNAGVTMVEAGVNEHNIGVVRAGPAGFHPGVGILGLPGSFIAGDAAQ
jgi:hypothetical protein